MVSTDRQTTKVIVVKSWCLQTDRQQKLLQLSHGVYRQTDNKIYCSEAMVSTDRQTTKVIVVNNGVYRQTDNKSYYSQAMVSTDRQTTKVIVVKPWCLQTDRQQKLLQ